MFWNNLHDEKPEGLIKSRIDYAHSGGTVSVGRVLFTTKQSQLACSGLFHHLGVFRFWWLQAFFCSFFCGKSVDLIWGAGRNIV